jgi:hypothetical protein
VTLSNALRWPVSSPWKLAHHGTATAYLSSGQRAVLLYVGARSRRGTKLRLRTLEEMSSALGMTSRGQVSRELRRLRQLELIGYRTRRGPRGWHRVWLNRSAARLRVVRSGRRRDNDSLSTLPGRFISRQGVERAEARKRGHPPGAGEGAGVGPRRGHDPPRVLYARCPIGHTARLPGGPWTRARGGQLVRAEWSGVCRQCGDRPIREVIELEVVAPLPRPLSADELADPARLERRRRLALEAAADPSTPLHVREQIRRDYLDRDPESSSSTSTSEPRRGPLADELDRLNRRPPPSRPPGAGGDQ